ncbi:hypothetical protein ACFQV4_29450 [Streptomyces thermocarboxydus]
MLRSAEYYRSNDIDVVTDEWVADVVLDRDGSGTAVTRSGRTFDFGSRSPRAAHRDGCRSRCRPRRCPLPA